LALAELKADLRAGFDQLREELSPDGGRPELRTSRRPTVHSDVHSYAQIATDSWPVKSSRQALQQCAARSSRPDDEIPSPQLSLSKGPRHGAESGTSSEMVMVHADDNVNDMTLNWKGGGAGRRGSIKERHPELASRALARLGMLSSDSQRSLSADKRAVIRTFAHHLVVTHGKFFDIFIGVVIIVNTVCIGVEMQLMLDQNPSVQVLHDMEHAFLACFVVEVLLRVLALGISKVVQSRWFMFDLVIVSTGVTSTWIVEPIVAQNAVDSGAVELMNQVMIIRFLRLLRIVRALRLVEIFKDLWTICRGLVQAARCVTSACALIIVVVYVMGCLAVEVITRSEVLLANAESAAIVHRHFDTLPVAMMTIFQFCESDSVAAIYAPLVHVQPSLAIFFIIIWLVLSVLIMNLVTAVIVQSAIGQHEEDTEMHRLEVRKQLWKLTPSIEKMFSDLDKDEDNAILREDLMNMDPASFRIPSDLSHIVKADQLMDLFDFFDMDRSGKVEQEEFVEGVFHLALSNVPAETTQTLHILRMIQRRLCFMENSIETLIQDRSTDNTGMQADDPAY